MKIGLLMVALLVLPGCVPGGSPLPTATARLHLASIDLPRGSYCWNSGGRGECADSVGPEVLLRTGDLKPYQTAGGFDAEVLFKSSSQLSSFNVELAYGPGSPTTIEIKAPRKFAVPQVAAYKTGVYVYTVSGRWPEGDVTFFLALELVAGSD